MLHFGSGGSMSNLIENFFRRGSMPKSRLVLTILTFAILAVSAIAQTPDSLIISSMAIPPGDSNIVPIYLSNHNFSVGGFSLRVILKDSLYTSISRIERGSAAANFDYFNVRVSRGVCKIVAIANMPGGGDPPPLPLGIHEIVKMHIVVGNDAPWGAWDSLLFREDSIPPYTDNAISDSTGYIYTIPVFKNGKVLFDVFSGVGENPASLPRQIELSQNYPNPFNAETTIKFVLPFDSNDISLNIYDLLGREIRKYQWNGLSAGAHNVIWNGKNYDNSPVASGVYFYRLTAPDYHSDAMRMTLLK